MNSRQTILADVRSIPAMAKTTSRMVTLLEDPSIDISEVIDAIKYDPGLTAHVLKLANSTYFGYARSVTSIPHAIDLIGIRQVQRLVIAASFSSLMSKSLAGYDLAEGELWKHSVASAIASEKLCTMLTLEVTDITFTAALLHDIGKLVLSRFVDKEFSKIESVAHKENESFEEAEKDILGVDHTEVGAVILESWSFPKELVDAVRWHHNPEGFKGKNRMVLDIVHVADALCLMGGIGVGREGLQYRPSEEVVTRLGLKKLTLETIVGQTMSGMGELKELLELKN